MEEAPVTAATGALGPVVAKLSALVHRRGEYQLQIQAQVRPLNPLGDMGEGGS